MKWTKNASSLYHDDHLEAKNYFTCLVCHFCLCFDGENEAFARENGICMNVSYLPSVRLCKYESYCDT